MPQNSLTKPTQEIRLKDAADSFLSILVALGPLGASCRLVNTEQIVLSRTGYHLVSSKFHQ
jgi:hypothetical protein